VDNKKQQEVEEYLKKAKNLFLPREERVNAGYKAIEILSFYLEYLELLNMSNNILYPKEVRNKAGEKGIESLCKKKEDAAERLVNLLYLDTVPREIRIKGGLIGINLLAKEGNLRRLSELKKDVFLPKEIKNEINRIFNEFGFMKPPKKFDNGPYSDGKKKENKTKITR
jgi:hypothetical protein